MTRRTKDPVFLTDLARELGYAKASSVQRPIEKLGIAVFTAGKPGVRWQLAVSAKDADRFRALSSGIRIGDRAGATMAEPGRHGPLRPQAGASAPAAGEGRQAAGAKLSLRAEPAALGPAGDRPMVGK